MSAIKGNKASTSKRTLATDIYNLSPSQVEERINDSISHLSQQLADPLGGAFGSNALSGLAGAGKGADDPVKTAARETLEELKELSRVYGLDAKQAHACIRMALGLPVTNAAFTQSPDNDDLMENLPPHVPNQTLGAKFIKLILPRPGAVYGRELVLDVLGCLGPAPGALEAPAAEKKRRNRSAAAAARDAAEEDSSDAEEEESTKEKKKTSGKPFRRHVHLKVQSLALKLLILLLDTPAITIDTAHHHPHPSVAGEATAVPNPDRNGNADEPAIASASLSRTIQRSLPSSFLDVQARRMLDKCYGVLFHFMEYQTLRPQLCYLLCKITRRKHVKNYRVAKLLSLRTTYPSELALSSLLAVYGNFYPDLLFPDLIAAGSGGGGAAISASMNLGLLSGGGVPPPGLKYPDVGWLLSVVELHRFPGGLPAPPSAEERSGVEQDGSDADRASKRRKLTAAARDAAISIATGLGGSGGGGSGPTYNIPTGAVISVDASSLIISELPSIRSLGMALDRLQLPSQLASALANRLVRLAVLVDDDKELYERMAQWLISALEDEIGAAAAATTSSSSDPAAGLARVGALVESVHEFFALAGELPVALQNWLFRTIAAAARAVQKGQIAAEQYFGKVKLQVLLPLLVLVKPDAPEAITNNIISPLTTIARSPYTPRAYRVQLIVSLTRMLDAWSTLDWRRAFRQAQGPGDGMRYGISTIQNCSGCFDSIKICAGLLSDLVARLMRSQTRSIQAHKVALDTYYVLSGPLAGFHASVLPPTPLTLHLILASTIYSPSRLFSLTQLLRHNFEVWEFAQEELLEQSGQVEDSTPKNSREGHIKQTESTYYDEANREDLNKMVVVLADAVWRVKGFSTVDEEPGISIGLGKTFFTRFRQRTDDRGESALMIASLTQGNPFVNLAEQYMYELSREHGWHGQPMRPPISQSALKAARTRHGFPAAVVWTDFRAKFLGWLGDKGAPGLHELLSAIMSSLRTAPPAQNTGTPAGSQTPSQIPIATAR